MRFHGLVSKAILLGFLLPGCSGGIPADVDPRLAWRNLSGGHLEGREPPPGLDEAWPNLATVPPRPAPPTPQERAGITAGLAANRAGAATPVGPRRGPGGPPVPMAGGPPAPPRLVAAPAVRLGPAPRAVAPAAEPLPAPLGVPPAPGRDLLAAPPPPSADLLAPSGPPPAPSSDLLAPRSVPAPAR